MFKNIKAKTEQMNDLITRAETLVNTAEAEKRELTEAEAQELAEIRDNVKAIKDFLGIVDDIDEARETKPVEAEAQASEERSLTDAKEIETREYKAFDNYLRGVVTNERAGELSPANNGAIIPTTIAKKIIELVYDVCPVLDRSEKYNIGGKLEIPYYPANSKSQISVAFAPEFTDLASSTGDFTTITLNGYLAGALTKVSKSLINNVSFDLVGFVVKRMAYDIARFIEANLLGNGGATSSVVGLGGVTKIITTASASAIDVDELIALQGSVKDIYQENAVWIMSPKTRDALRTLRNQLGIYLLNDDLSAPFGKTILGKPVFVSDNMPDIATGEKVIYYGDMSGLATKFSEELTIEVLREVYAPQHAVGVVGWLEFDAKVQDQQKLACLKMA